ncbi:MAG: sensor histidine kinase [Candidatus Binatia bacterium]
MTGELLLANGCLPQIRYQQRYRYDCCAMRVGMFLGGSLPSVENVEAGLVGLKRLLQLRSRLDSDFVADKKRAVITLRWVLIIAAGYLMLFSGDEWPGLAVSVVVVVLMASNVAIGRLPDRLVAHAGFDALMLLVDTILLTTGFYLTKAISSDFYVIYFFIIFLAGASENLFSVLAGSLLASAAYLALARGSFGIAPVRLAQENAALHAFFILAVALFYGFLVERIRLDRERRQVEYVARLESVNAQLRELDELKQAFLNAVSHELRTPLNAVLGYIDIVRDGTVGELESPAREYIERAYHRGRHLMRLIEELLNFASLSRGEASTRRTRTDLRELVEKVRATADPSARAKGLALRFEVGPDVSTVTTDNIKIIQILLHLVTNAIKFTNAGEVRVSVACRQVPRGGTGHATVLELTVADTGPGISREQQPGIFDAFRQVDRSLARKHGGLGLGLATCRGLVDLLHGEIRVDSTPGRGSTFVVRIPAGAPGTEPTPTGRRDKARASQDQDSTPLRAPAN